MKTLMIGDGESEEVFIYDFSSKDSWGTKWRISFHGFAKGKFQKEGKGQWIV